MIRKALPLLAVAAALAACGGPEEADFRDRSGPSVTEVVPADGTTDVPIDTEVEVKFSESILVRKKLTGGRVEEFDFGGFVATDADGKAVAGFITFNNDSLVFRPAEGLAYKTKYTFAVNERVKDLFGNPAKPFEWSFETEADRLAPTVPYNIVYPSLTNEASIDIEGSMDPDSTLIFNGKRSVKHPKNGAFKLSVALTEGSNTFTFSAVDDAGNESAQVEIAVVRDSTPPAALETCAPGVLKWHAGIRSGCWNPPATIYWNKPNLPIGAQWTPAANDTAYFALGSQASPACTTAQCEYAGFSPKLVGGGTVELRAYTVDQAGNQTVAFKRNFVYDDLPPALWITSPLPATTNASAGSFTLGKEAGARYFATIDGAAAAPCADAATSCTVTYALADGVHRFAMTATDAAGNETRVTRFVEVDTVAPRVYMLPATGSTPASSPKFHVFAEEPVTTSALTLTNESLTPISDATSRGRHWEFSAPTLALADPELATIAVYDAAGNRTAASAAFSPGTYAHPATGYATFTTGGTGRNRAVTFSGLPAPLSVAVYNDGGAPGTYAFVPTTGTSLTLSLDPLSRVDGRIYALDDNGDIAEYTLLPTDPWNHGAPALSFTVTDARGAPNGPNFGRVLPVSGGFGYFTDTGMGYWHDGTQLDIADCNQSTEHLFPALLGLDGYWALQGKSCVGGAGGVRVVPLEPTGLEAGTAWPLWPAPAAESNFGWAITSAAFYGSGLQIAVASPDGDGAVYLYDSTMATAPSYRLVGDDPKHARFGDSLAFAARHHAGKDVLAVIAPDEPAVYFFDADIYTNQASDPLGLFRVRAGLPTNACYSGQKGRHEVVNVGNLDGDAAGSDDLVVAAWPESCLSKELILLVYLGGQGAAGTDPIVLRQPYGTENFSLAMPRIVPLGDLNGDGRADFGFAQTTSGSMARVFYGTPSGKPETRLLYPPASVTPGSWWVLGGANDVDGDALPDLILSVQSSTGSNQTLMSRP